MTGTIPLTKEGKGRNCDKEVIYWPLITQDSLIHTKGHTHKDLMRR